MISRRRACLLPWLALAAQRQLLGQSAAELKIPGGVIEVQFVAGRVTDPDAVFDWIKRAAQAVGEFYGEFPVPRLRLLVESGNKGKAVAHGVTYPGSPPFINVSIRGDATSADFADDWILTHEFVHLAFPSVPPAHLWMEEGLSTYLEPLARTRAGQMPVAEYWRDLVQSLPQGQPRNSDGGLDGTRAWARTYWGGALFCFVADLRIRQQAGPKTGLQQALQFLVKEGATINREWPLRRVLELADQGIGAPILQEDYGEWAQQAVRVDLEEIWRGLGVRIDGVAVVFDDRAPMSGVRKEMTTAT